MKNSKLKLDDLKISSFVTAQKGKEMTIKAGGTHYEWCDPSGPVKTICYCDTSIEGIQ